MMFRPKKPTFSVSIADGVLESVYDECDRYDVDETGGRLLGFYRHRNGRYEIDVRAVLAPGPNAQRSPTYFLQDGDYQERQFRAIEAKYPEIEHLGNWHTHHVNGYQTLSGGDKETYFKTVNHGKYNTDIFYALLVVRKNKGGKPRYTVKHFIFRRGDDTIYEIPGDEVRIVNDPVLLPPAFVEETGSTESSSHRSHIGKPNPQRAKDQEFFTEFYPGLKAFQAKGSGTPYWKGALTLVDGSRADVVAKEDFSEEGEEWSYSIATSPQKHLLVDVATEYRERKFPSARHAVLQLERDFNQILYRDRQG